MSTVHAPRLNHHHIPSQQVPPHTTVLGGTRMWCIQENCDGKKHFYCSCS